MTTQTHEAPGADHINRAGKKREKAKANGQAGGQASSDLPLEVHLEDFLAYMPERGFIFMPTGQIWPAAKHQYPPAADRRNPQGWQDHQDLAGHLAHSEPASRANVLVAGCTADHSRLPHPRGRLDQAEGRQHLQSIHRADARAWRSTESDALG
jgi:hypothetical protein